MSGMAEVLAAHHVSHADWDESEIAVICHCGVEIVGQDNGEEAYVQEEELYALHLEAALTAAGFGPVKEAAAKALEDAADDPKLRLSGHSGISITRIRARAAAVRGEG